MSLSDWVTAICVQAQTANIFARLFTFETGRLPLETEMIHRSCDVSHWKALSYFWRNCHVLMCLNKFGRSLISWAWKHWKVHESTSKHEK
jgi:hypothetical protein